MPFLNPMTLFYSVLNSINVGLPTPRHKSTAQSTLLPLEPLSSKLFTIFFSSRFFLRFFVIPYPFAWILFFVFPLLPPNLASSTRVDFPPPPLKSWIYSPSLSSSALFSLVPGSHFQPLLAASPPTSPPISVVACVQFGFGWKGDAIYEYSLDPL